MHVVPRAAEVPQQRRVRQQLPVDAVALPQQAEVDVHAHGPQVEAGRVDAAAEHVQYELDVLEVIQGLVDEGRLCRPHRTLRRRHRQVEEVPARARRPRLVRRKSPAGHRAQHVVRLLARDVVQLPAVNVVEQERLPVDDATHGVERAQNQPDRVPVVRPERRQDVDQLQYQHPVDVTLRVVRAADHEADDVLRHAGGVHRFRGDLRAQLAADVTHELLVGRRVHAVRLPDARELGVFRRFSPAFPRQLPPQPVHRAGAGWSATAGDVVGFVAVTSTLVT